MIRFAFLAVLLTGCAFNPVSGTYVLEEGDSETDCETTDTGTTDTGSDEESTVDVAVNEEKTEMTMTYGSAEEGGTMAIDCTLDGKEFDCPIEPTTLDGSAYGADFTYTAEMDMGGNWTGSDSFEMTATTTQTCEGADCETYSMQSCTSTATVTAALQE